MILTDSDRKKLSIKTKKKIEESIKKKKKVNVRKLFDVWSSIATEFQDKFKSVYYCSRAYNDGYNYATNSIYLYKKFIKDNKKKYHQNLFKLLNLSKNNTPQSTGKDRKFPFKQKVFPDEMNDNDWYALPGEDIAYSSKKITNNHYDRSYFRKSKIPFFKGPEEQEKFILSKKWHNLFSYGFIYGYCLSWQNLIRINWRIIKKDNDKNFPDVNVELKRIIPENPWIQIDLKEIFTKSLSKCLKINISKSNDIYAEIQDSMYNSVYTLFLNSKKENYFTFRKRNFKRILEFKYEQVGTSEFLEGILRHRNLYLGNSTKGRFFNTVYNYRFDERKNGISGNLYNYEQLLMYSMSLEYLEPLDFNKLDILEKDIFLRFAINRGKDEFLDYAFGKIF